VNKIQDTINRLGAVMQSMESSSSVDFISALHVMQDAQVCLEEIQEEEYKTEKVTQLKQPFTSQMDEMVKHAKKRKPTVLLMALMADVEGDRKMFCDWSMASSDELVNLRALIDNQIEQAVFRENMKYSFLPPEFYAEWPDGSGDPDDVA